MNDFQKQPRVLQAAGVLQTYQHRLSNNCHPVPAEDLIDPNGDYLTMVHVTEPCHGESIFRTGLGKGANRPVHVSLGSSVGSRYKSSRPGYSLAFHICPHITAAYTLANKATVSRPPLMAVAYVLMHGGNSSGVQVDYDTIFTDTLARTSPNRYLSHVPHVFDLAVDVKNAQHRFVDAFGNIDVECQKVGPSRPLGGAGEPTDASSMEPKRRKITPYERDVSSLTIDWPLTRHKNVNPEVMSLREYCRPFAYNSTVVAQKMCEGDHAAAMRGTNDPPTLAEWEYQIASPGRNRGRDYYIRKGTNGTSGCQLGYRPTSQRGLPHTFISFVFETKWVVIPGEGGVNRRVLEENAVYRRPFQHLGFFAGSLLRGESCPTKVGQLYPSRWLPHVLQSCWLAPTQEQRMRGLSGELIHQHLVNSVPFSSVTDVSVHCEYTSHFMHYWLSMFRCLECWMCNGEIFAGQDRCFWCRVPLTEQGFARFIRLLDPGVHGTINIRDTQASIARAREEEGLRPLTHVTGAVCLLVRSNTALAVTSATA